MAWASATACAAPWCARCSRRRRRRAMTCSSWRSGRRLRRPTTRCAISPPASTACCRAGCGPRSPSNWARTSTTPWPRRRSGDAAWWSRRCSPRRGCCGTSPCAASPGGRRWPSPWARCCAMSWPRAGVLRRRDQVRGVGDIWLSLGCQPRAASTMSYSTIFLRSGPSASPSSAAVEGHSRPVTKGTPQTPERQASSSRLGRGEGVACVVILRRFPIASLASPLVLPIRPTGPRRTHPVA